MNVRIKIIQESSLTEFYPESSEKRHIYEDQYNSAEQTLKLNNCKDPVLSQHRKANEHNNKIFNDSISDFEASLGDEDVITFFNSKINQNFQCLSIVITKNHQNPDSSSNSNYSYCIELKNCNKKLPFVCKIEVNEPKVNSSKSAVDFYPDSLRNYQQDPKMSYVMNSFLAVIYGLSRVHQNVII